MSEITKTYEPQSVEDKWYQFWLDQKCFVANEHSVKPAYSIVIPPPNVTGVLTMGHVLNNTIQDILCRKARMDGKAVLWLPGTDHAGIATQTVVERTLKKSGEIRHRDDLGREKFLERVWQWKEKHGGIIIQQLKKLGASCDWTRERFTMDPEYSRCVQKVFVELYNTKDKDGNRLIYKGHRMVNWCPATQTALSDEEVIMKEQKGLLYYFKVEVAEEPGTFLTIATTRPETIPGDTAVAVNPKDPRYAKYIGKNVVRPLPAEYPKQLKLIPIIGDEHVDFEFGTGVLKVTPAHDKADFEIGLRHKLNAPEVINANGTMNDAAGQDLKGLDRFKARKVAVEKLTELGALEKEEPYTNNVGYSERADVPIEPRLSWQWFLKYPSAEKARDVVAKGEMKFHPERWAKVYDHWMGGLQDWCISRQLWWGHRIPVWYRKIKLESLPGLDMSEGFNTVISNIDPKDFHVGIEPPPDLENWEQDPDVLDTWFSSWLWPFATMGWPEQTDTLKKFYPTTDLVTGPDIIFFWVARMIMAGYEFMGEPRFGLPDAMPFKNVYFTGIIRDKQGRKMSKSLGNSPDPLDLIGKYGADALRFGVMRAAPLGQDILFDEQNVELGRNFCNKLWNACRFRQMQGGGDASSPNCDGGVAATFEVQGEIDPKLLTPDDKWILLKLDAAIREMNTAFAEYKFSDATATLYRFFWSEYCDWYVEASKAALQTDDAARKANTLAVIDFVLSHTLRLFHPFLPFITEELWHGMGYNTDMPENQGGKTIMFAPWPKPLDDDFQKYYGLDNLIEKQADAKFQAVSAIRELKAEHKLNAKRDVEVIISPSLTYSSVFNNSVELASTQSLSGSVIQINPNFVPAKDTATRRTLSGETVYMPLAGLIDFAAEKNRLTKELAKIESEISKVGQKLANPNFTQKVPANVLEEHKQRLADWQGKLAHVKAALAALQN
jgi:valyl-tRNA synthetase